MYFLAKFKIKDFSPNDYKREYNHHHNHHGYNRITRRRSLSKNLRKSHSKMTNIHLKEVYDKNGHPIKNAFIKISNSKKKALKAARIKSKILKQKKTKKSKRKLFLGALTGGLGDMIGGAGDAISGAPAGAVVGVGAAAAGMAARTARKEQHYFDITKVQLQTNFNDFRKDYLDYEFTELRECNRVSAKINGMLSTIEKDLAYRVNNRILEMIDSV